MIFDLRLIIQLTLCLFPMFIVPSGKSDSKNSASHRVQVLQVIHKAYEFLSNGGMRQDAMQNAEQSLLPDVFLATIDLDYIGSDEKKVRTKIIKNEEEEEREIIYEDFYSLKKKIQ